MPKEITSDSANTSSSAVMTPEQTATSDSIADKTSSMFLRAKNFVLSTSESVRETFYKTVDQIDKKQEESSNDSSKDVSKSSSNDPSSSKDSSKKSSSSNDSSKNSSSLSDSSKKSSSKSSSKPSDSSSNSKFNSSSRKEQ
ncbi:hypothetical protein NEHOM01_0892 [Nematocida homosporus]|uniref:uncharacterized protein n=1 Tax=Nematocida homosporus TaxID=1912981 RepID=UPI0022203E89|nr:uncharacterized protein NEHOM01_0892 [Nematocida homosporus]KAI5185533.1 hypothetical protein NEHOM01_0892 [Nematocida homosporus]